MKIKKAPPYFHIAHGFHACHGTRCGRLGWCWRRPGRQRPSHDRRRECFHARRRRRYVIGRYVAFEVEEALVEVEGHEARPTRPTCRARTQAATRKGNKTPRSE